MITTFFTEQGMEKYKTVQDATINELLQEVNSKFDNLFLVKEHKEVKKRLLHPNKTHIKYSVYAKTIGFGDYQIINFCQEANEHYKSNIVVSKSYVVTYFLGMLTGYDYSNKSNK